MIKRARYIVYTGVNKLIIRYSQVRLGYLLESNPGIVRLVIAPVIAADYVTYIIRRGIKQESIRAGNGDRRRR